MVLGPGTSWAIDKHALHVVEYYRRSMGKPHSPCHQRGDPKLSPASMFAPIAHHQWKALHPILREKMHTKPWDWISLHGIVVLPVVMRTAWLHVQPDMCGQYLKHMHLTALPVFMILPLQTWLNPSGGFRITVTWTHLYHITRYTNIQLKPFRSLKALIIIPGFHGDRELKFAI